MMNNKESSSSGAGNRISSTSDLVEDPTSNQPNLADLIRQMKNEDYDLPVQHLLVSPIEEEGKQEEYEDVVHDEFN